MVWILDALRGVTMLKEQFDKIIAESQEVQKRNP
jgi:hypothetical protein